MIARLNLAAARIGDLAAARLASLPEPGSPGTPTVPGTPGIPGSVESVYRNAVNVGCLYTGCGEIGFGGSGRGCDGGCGAWSVCLLPEGAPLHPYAVTVSEMGYGPGARPRAVGAARRDFEGGTAFLDARLGETVFLSRHAVEFGGGRLSISMDAAEVFDSRLRPPASLGAGDVSRLRDAIWRGVVAEISDEGGRGDPVPAIGARGEAAHQVTSHFLRAAMESRGIALDCDRCDRGPAGLMAEATRGRLAAVTEALLARPAAGGGEARADALAESLGRLVGFGEGLTPSGDDFLLGALAAARYLPASRFMPPAAGRAPLEAAIAEMLPTLGAATTRESCRMLEAAVAGHYPEPILGLLAAAVGDNPDGVHHWVGCLRELGGTSGQDMLAGVLAWLSGQGREHQQASDALLCRAAGGV